MSPVRSHRYFRRATGWTLSLAALFGASAAAAKPKIETLDPLSPWQIEQRADSCTLSAVFGSVRDPFVIHLERFTPGNAFQLLFTGKRLEWLAPPRKLAIEYGAGGYVHDLPSYMPGKTPNGTPVIFTNSRLADGPELTPPAEAAITQIALRMPGDKQLVLKTGSLGEPFAAFRACTDRLVQSWGFDPGQQRRLSRKPRPKSDPGGWLTSKDYPGGALFSRTQSVVNFRLDVDPQGTPTRCAVLRSYSGEQFDKATCDLLMRRARFEPALNADGKPTASYYTNSVRWMLP